MSGRHTTPTAGRGKRTELNIDKISIGENPPDDINVLIEIPAGGAPVKYELEKESGVMYVDRFLHTAMHYPCNYGFIPHTLSEDGDPMDAAVLGQSPVIPGCVIRSRPIGVLIMEDESGVDEKILCVPVDELHPYYADVKGLEDVRQIMRDQLEHFFTHYKDLEPGKWVKVKHWGDIGDARRLITEAINRANG